jgi:large subunit ribosomal protein L13
MSTRTFFPTREAAQAGRKWWLIDATGLPLGRLASEAARRLTGKHLPTWTPHVDVGDFVVITNAAKVVLTGGKALGKLYRRHSGQPGGLKEIAAGKLLAEKPTRVVELAIKGMLPKTRLGRAMVRKLKVHAGPDHPHGAQEPQPVDIGVAPVEPR